jgi:hypothetical protein
MCSVSSFRHVGEQFAYWLGTFPPLYQLGELALPPIGGSVLVEQVGERLGIAERTPLLERGVRLLPVVDEINHRGGSTSPFACNEVRAASISRLRRSKDSPVRPTVFLVRSMVYELHSSTPGPFFSRNLEATLGCGTKR